MTATESNKNITTDIRKDDDMDVVNLQTDEFGLTEYDEFLASGMANCAHCGTPLPFGYGIKVCRKCIRLALEVEKQKAIIRKMKADECKKTVIRNHNRHSAEINRHIARRMVLESNGVYSIANVLQSMNNSESAIRPSDCKNTNRRVKGYHGEHTVIAYKRTAFVVANC